MLAHSLIAQEHMTEQQKHTPMLEMNVQYAMQQNHLQDVHNIAMNKNMMQQNIGKNVQTVVQKKKTVKDIIQVESCIIVEEDVIRVDMNI